MLKQALGDSPTPARSWKHENCITSRVPASLVEFLAMQICCISWKSNGQRWGLHGVTVKAPSDGQSRGQ